MIAFEALLMWDCALLPMKSRGMKVKICTICVLLAQLMGLNIQAQQFRGAKPIAQSNEFVADSLQLSLITCGPGIEVYELFGHTALRAKYTGSHRFDVVFNYGLFSFDTPNFIWRFTKGETDYYLGVNRYEYFLYEYVMRNSRVDEQILNLTPEEKLALFYALQENARPENREYRYNFLFNNCATAPRDKVEEVLGKVCYQEPVGELPTFREEIHRCVARCPWLVFGIDLALGAELDRPMTYRERMFIPEALRQAFAVATMQCASDSTARPLVAQSVELFVPETPAQPDEIPFYLTPLVVGWLLLALVLLLSIRDIRRDRCARWVDSLLFLFYGMGGVLLFFLMFCSEHPATSVNYSAIWMHPFWLLIAVAIWFKSLKRVVRYYHFANFAVLLLFMMLWHWIPQQFNPAFIPLVGVLILRSFTYIMVDRGEWKLKRKGNEK